MLSARSDIPANVAHGLALAALAGVALRPGVALDLAASAGLAGDASVLGVTLAAAMPVAIPATLAAALTSWRLRSNGASVPGSLAPALLLAISGLLVAASWAMPAGLAANLVLWLGSLTAYLLVGGVAVAAVAVPAEVGGTVPEATAHAHVIPFPEPANERLPDAADEVALAA